MEHYDVLQIGEVVCELQRREHYLKDIHIKELLNNESFVHAQMCGH